MSCLKCYFISTAGMQSGTYSKRMDIGVNTWYAPDGTIISDPSKIDTLNSLSSSANEVACQDTRWFLTSSAVCISRQEEDIDAYRITKITETGTELVRYEDSSGTVIEIQPTDTIQSGECCCGSSSPRRPQAESDNAGAFSPSVPKEVDVGLNDLKCDNPAQTAYALVAGSEVGCTVTPSYSTDGKFTVVATGIGDPSFQYEIYCAGVPSGSIGAVSGKVASVAITKTTPAQDLYNKSVGDPINYTITVINNGTADLDTVTVSDNNVALSCPATSLLAGDSMSCTGTYSIQASDLPAGIINNTASVDADAGGVLLHQEAYAQVRLHTVDAVDDIVPDSIVITSGTTVSVNVSSNDNACDHGQTTSYRLITGSNYNCTVTPTVSANGVFNVVPNPSPCINANFGFRYELLCNGVVMDTAEYRSRTCKGANTGTWSVSGLTATDSNGIRFVFTTAGQAGVPYIGQGNFNSTGTWWSTPLANAQSLECNMAWDTSPNTPQTALPDADMGSGTMTIIFPCAVKDPVLNIDRLGGSGNTTTRGVTTARNNSLTFTLLSGATSLTRLSGTNDFEVNGGNTITRTGGVYLIPPNPAVSSEASNIVTHAAAGSVRMNGTFTQVAFSWTGSGYEEAGLDGVEFIVSDLCNKV